MSYGPIKAWIPLSGLSRILVVYNDSCSAGHAKKEMDRFVIEGCELENSEQGGRTITQEDRDLVRNLPRTVFRVYSGHQTCTSEVRSTNTATGEEQLCEAATLKNQTDWLMPPISDKNFLISPPGSPPVGWEQLIEDAPNQASLADDLCQRLRFLSVGEEAAREDQDEEGQTGEIVILPAQTSLNFPALKIQTTERVGTRPAMGIGLVKATIESMVGPRISPSPRPALSS